ncbi:hypothetical protein IWQ61_001128 [Dispira simplex]|nr:hypothetical protein IWQ61_001128 [Dispira simplex]
MLQQLAGRLLTQRWVSRPTSSIQTTRQVIRSAYTQRWITPNQYISPTLRRYASTSSGKSEPQFDQTEQLVSFASFLLFGGTFLYMTWQPSPVRGNGNIPALESFTSSQTASFTDSQAQEPLPEAPVTSLLNQPLTGEALPLADYYPYVLVGGGTASYHALRAIKEHDPEAEILIIGDEPFPPYSRPPLSKELWFTQDRAKRRALRFTDWQNKEQTLWYHDINAYRLVRSHPDHGTALVYSAQQSTKAPLLLAEHRVTDMDVEKQIVRLDNQQVIRYGKILLATGGTPRELELVADLPDNLREHVTTFRDVCDYQRLEATADRAKHIVVVGGGLLGSELAYALAAGRKLYVTQVLPETNVLHKLLPRYLAEWTTQLLTKGGVKVITQQSVTNIRAITEGSQPETAEPRRLRVELSNGDVVEADHVVQAMGIEPNVALAKRAGLEMDATHGGIVVNAELETRRNVYVAGDVASFHDVLLGRRRVEHYDHAAQSGYLAGKNMCGARDAYTHQPMFWSDLGPNVTFDAVGVIDASLHTASVWAKPAESEDSAHTEQYGQGLIYYLRDSRIVGMVMWNLPGRVELARQVVLRGEFRYKHVQGLTRMFNIHQLENSSSA